MPTTTELDTCWFCGDDVYEVIDDDTDDPFAICLDCLDDPDLS